MICTKRKTKEMSDCCGAVYLERKRIKPIYIAAESGRLWEFPKEKKRQI